MSEIPKDDNSSKEKSTFKFSESTKTKLRVLSDAEKRSMSNYLETLIDSAYDDYTNQFSNNKSIQE